MTAAWRDQRAIHAKEEIHRRDAEYAEFGINNPPLGDLRASAVKIPTPTDLRIAPINGNPPRHGIS
jgi:hypothetical protein